MDSRWAKILREWIGLGVVLGGMLLYSERRIASLEQAQALAAREAGDLRRAVEVLRDRADARLDLDRDGGFAEPAVRAMVSRTVELEARRLQLFDAAAAERFSAALEQRIREAVRAELRAAGK